MLTQRVGTRVVAQLLVDLGAVRAGQAGGFAGYQGGPPLADPPAAQRGEGARQLGDEGAG